MDTFVGYALQAGMAVIEACEVANQCESEVVRISLRTQNILSTLKTACDHFPESTGLQAKILELREIFEDLRVLLGRCARPKGIAAKASRLINAETNRLGLLKAERELERLTADLGLPILTDIKKHLAEMQAENRRVVAEEGKRSSEEMSAQMKDLMATMQATMQAEFAKLGLGEDYSARDAAESAPAPPSERKPVSGGLARVMNRLGRVRLDKLEEGDEILGVGQFGVVRKGKYHGVEVAVKKATASVGAPAVVDSFRCSCNRKRCRQAIVSSEARVDELSPWPFCSVQSLL